MFPFDDEAAVAVCLREKFGLRVVERPVQPLVIEERASAALDEPRVTVVLDRARRRLSVRRPGTLPVSRGGRVEQHRGSPLDRAPIVRIIVR